METQQNKAYGRYSPIIRAVFSLFFFAVLLYFFQPYLTVDFWYDEVLSLEEFILVPLKKTVTDYSVPNNHVFFSLLMNLWLKLWGIETFAQAANNIFIIRLLPFLFTGATLVVIASVESKITRLKGMNLSIILLIGCMPFYNTLAQVRGYGLSMLLVSVVFYISYLYYEKPKVIYGISISIFTALLLYTIPSNLYAVLSALVVLACIFIYQWYKYHFLIALRFNAIKLIGCLILGIGFAVLLYLPLGEQVINNEYVKSEGMFRWAIWGEALQVFKYMLMPYFIPLIIIALGIGIALAKKVNINWVLVLTVIIILPFVFSFIRGSKPFDRTFLWISPIVALTAALLASVVYKYWLRNTMLHNSFKEVVLVATLFAVGYANADIQKTLKKGLETGTKYQNIYYNYYQGNYNPQKNLGLLKEKYYQEGTQVFLHEVDKRAMPAYLSVHDLKWQPFKDTIPKINEYYIVTAFEQQAIEEYKQYDSSFTFTRLNKELDFVNIIQAKRTK